MKAETRSIRLVFRHYPEDGQFNVSDLDFGLLIGGLTEEPDRLAYYGAIGADEERGHIKLELERPHEWEFVLGAIVTGGAIFAKGIIETLGKRLGTWIADQVEKKRSKEKVKVRGSNDESVTIDPENVAEARDAFYQVLLKTAERNGTVVILFPW